MILGSHELFYTPTAQTSFLTEKIYLQERAIADLGAGIPPVARRSYLFKLIMDEITSTNEIEGTRSTRQEVLEALEARPHENKRFREMARLYLSLSDDADFPATLEELRSTYDELMQGELAEQDQPDGQLFRAGPVYIKDGAGHTVHHGVLNEEDISKNILLMFSHLRDDDVPKLFSAVVGHFIFEATHPFYDGNGRFGRFLLSASLRLYLSPHTVLTLSRKINEEKTKYYKAFTAVEEPKNYADATPFLIALLELIVSAQVDLIEDFQKRFESMKILWQRTEKLKEKPDIGKNLAEVLWILGQAELFGSEQSISWDELAESLSKARNTVRKWINLLENEGYLERASSRPLRVRLSAVGKKLLFES